ncbi:MAG: hypothetical protein Q7U78_05255 [Gallionella sp.]|nr:hypothetical protein [Gallionella sp.]
MRTIESRLLVLEQSLAKAVQRRPVPFGILPPIGDSRRAAVQAEIDARTKAGQRFITYEIV